MLLYCGLKLEVYSLKIKGGGGYVPLVPLPGQGRSHVGYLAGRFFAYK